MIGTRCKTRLFVPNSPFFKNQMIMQKLSSRNTRIGILIYKDFDSLDVAGPNQVFHFLSSNRANRVEHYLIGPKKGEIVTSLEGLEWKVNMGYNREPDTSDYLDVIFIPGGFGPGFEALLENKDSPFYKYLEKQVAMAKAANKTQLICSVCVGALLLARAGLLEGYSCTTHWAFKNVLSLFQGVLMAPGFPRYVVDRNRVTGGGISSGLDEALAIVEILRGADVAQQIQLTIQYAPNPPYTSGDPSVANASTVSAVSQRIGSGELYDLVKNFS